jgi:hypothetical protein
MSFHYPITASKFNRYPKNLERAFTHHQLSPQAFDPASEAFPLAS